MYTRSLLIGLEFDLYPIVQGRWSCWVQFQRTGYRLRDVLQRSCSMYGNNLYLKNNGTKIFIERRATSGTICEFRS